MKGMLFTELLEMVEKRYSPELADRVLRKATLPSGGIYTAVGRYPVAEWQSIIANLSTETGQPARTLIHDFGEYLFGTFKQEYPQLLKGITNSYALFEAVDAYIHVEVRKLHPDAQLPTFRFERPGDGSFVFDYISQRPLADLAEGLVHATLKHFKEKISVVRQDTPGGPPFKSRFVMRPGA